MTPPSKRLYVGLEVWAAVVLAAALWQVLRRLDFYQWDFVVYWQAARTFLAGHSPYGLLEGTRPNMLFVYPPLAALPFLPFTALDLGAAKLVWLGLKLAAFFGTVALWRRAGVMHKSEVPPLFFFTFALGSAALVDAVSGNIAIFEQLGIWLAFAALLSGRRWLFVLLIALTAQFKFTPAFFLLVLLVNDERPNWIPFFGGCFLFAALVATNWLLFPNNANAFIGNVASIHEVGGWNNPAMLNLFQDVLTDARSLGVSLPNVIAWVLYAATAITIFVSTVRWARNPLRHHRFTPQGRVLLLLVALATYAVVMPRMKDYSYVVLLPVAWYCMSSVMSHRHIALLAVLTLVPRPLPQLNITLPLTLLPYTYAPLIAALALWATLTRSEALARTPETPATDTGPDPRDALVPEGQRLETTPSSPRS